MNIYLIGYDVSDKKRLVKVHNCLTNHAIPLQRSVFLLWGTEANKDECLSDTIRLLDKHSDALCCYRLPMQGRKFFIGASPLPEGVFFKPLKFAVKFSPF